MPDEIEGMKWSGSAFSQHAGLTTFEADTLLARFQAVPAKRCESAWQAHVIVVMGLRVLIEQETDTWAGHGARLAAWMANYHISIERLKSPSMSPYAKS